MRKIKLTQGKFALVDDEDYIYINQYRWCYNAHNNTAMSRIKSKLVDMHRVIMSTPKGMDTHHKNHNSLDNRKMNLQICTHAENIRHMVKHKSSSSRYKGVHWNNFSQKWRARIVYNYRTIHLGRFLNEIDAAAAYNKAAVKYFGKFALLNEVP